MNASEVRHLLRRQFPSLAELPLRRVGEGFDNVQWRLGPDLVVRLPRRAAAATLVTNESRWLHEVIRDVRLETPAPLLEGHADEAFPWPWAIGHWIEGRPGDRVALNIRARSVETFAELLRDLHHRASRDAPQNPLRGGALDDRSHAMDEGFDALGGDQRAWRSLWRWTCSAPPATAPTWIHGDLHPGNLIYRDGTLVGVIDFGDLCRGDPATDLAQTMLLAPFGATLQVIDRYHPDPAMLRRSIGWAMLFASMFLRLGQHGRPTYRRLGDTGRLNVMAWSRELGSPKGRGE